MRFRLMGPAMILAVVVAFAACNAVDTTANGSLPQPPEKAAAPETKYADGARRVTTAELAKLIKEGNVFVVDVRNQHSYEAGHIPGSKLIPAGDVANRIDEFPRDKMIVTYCS